MIWYILLILSVVSILFVNSEWKYEFEFKMFAIVLLCLSVHFFTKEVQQPANNLSYLGPIAQVDSVPKFERLQDSVYYYLIVNDFIEPEIVLAQALHETNYFKSSAARNHNNFFGIIDNQKTLKAGHFVPRHFDHWLDGIIFYKNRIQNRLQEDENYYTFLSRIGYAEDPLYNLRIRIMTARVKNEYNMTTMSK